MGKMKLAALIGAFTVIGSFVILSKAGAQSEFSQTDATVAKMIREIKPKTESGDDYTARQAQLKLERLIRAAEKIRELRPKAESGDAQAQYELASLIMDTIDNCSETVTWLRRAADQKTDERARFRAMMLLGGIYSFGSCGVPWNRAEGERWLRKAMGDRQ